MNARQHGTALVETAIALPVLLTLLAGLALFGQALWQFNAMQKAVHDAARYMASIPVVEITNMERALSAKHTAQDMVRGAAIVAGIAVPPALESISVLCGSASACAGSSTKPSTVTVNVSVGLGGTVLEMFFGEWSSASSPLEVSLSATVPYMN